MYSPLQKIIIWTLLFRIFFLSCPQARPLNPPSTNKINFIPEGVELSAGCNECKSSITFSSEESKKYEVGTQIPFLPFKVKNSWAGNIEIPEMPINQNASLFFWFWAKDAKESGDDLVIWLNGGPSCQSILGLALENGPFLINSDRGPTRVNNYSWTIAANILYINQPVGVGFTTGNVINRNEFQFSDQFVRWLHKFYEIFPELLQKNLWITGESYEGYYSSFQVDAILRNPPGGNTSLYKGGMLIDPSFSNEATQFDVPVYQFAKEHQLSLLFSDDDLEKIKEKSDQCNLTNFAELYLHYPPQGRLPTPSDDCDVFNFYALLALNKSSFFDIYNVVMPYLDISVPDTFETFFDHPEVQSYIHAPILPEAECNQVFVKNSYESTPTSDSYPNYQNSYFARMIEKSSKFIILQGLLDGIVISQGNRIALQNLTWNNGQGFNKAPYRPLYDMDGNLAALGTDDERGLTYVEIPNSGHMVPEDQPSFALAALFHLLGKCDWTKSKKNHSH